jgi:hypothetical protein
VVAIQWAGYPASYTKGRTRPVQIIAIHATHGSEGDLSAENGVSWDKRRTDGTSCHIFVDSNSALREVPDTDRAHHARYHGNQIALGIEICGRADQSAAQWDDAVSRATLRNAANVAAQLCQIHKIPVRRLSVSETRAAYYNAAGSRPFGLAGHIDITKAFPEDDGDHTDPGTYFPWARFLAMVTEELTILNGGTTMTWSEELGPTPSTVARWPDDPAKTAESWLLLSAIHAKDADARTRDLAARLDSLAATTVALAGEVTGLMSVAGALHDQVAQLLARPPAGAPTDEQLDYIADAVADNLLPLQINRAA